jgi:MerR family mercuric resistance operon transcriptional regulator
LTLERGTARTLERVVAPTERSGATTGPATVLSIGQLAEVAGVHVETVRYYERRHLLPEPPRTPAGYRQYGPADVGRLSFIARAKSLGFTLAEVAELLTPSEPASALDPAPAADDLAVLELARRKLVAVQARRDELNQTEGRLRRLLDVCADPANEDCRALRISG